MTAAKEDGQIRLEPGRIARIVIDAPASRNAMTAAMWGALPEIAARVGADPATRVVVLTGAGGSLVKVEARKRLVWLAACCVLVTGGLTVTRGVASLLVPAGQTEPACPFCSDPEQPVLKILSNRHDD